MAAEVEIGAGAAEGIVAAVAAADAARAAEAVIVAHAVVAVEIAATARLATAVSQETQPGAASLFCAATFACRPMQLSKIESARRWL
jgi:hypothetical protein